MPAPLAERTRPLSLAGKPSFQHTKDKNRNLLTVTMDPLRAQVIERIDALLARDVATFTTELCCLQDLVPDNKMFVDLTLNNALGGPPIWVWDFPEPVFKVLLQLFTEGRYSVKVHTGDLELTGALAAARRVPSLPMIRSYDDFKSSKQHWTLMTVHAGVVPNSGHWIAGKGNLMAFHWAPKAGCAACAGVAPL